MAFVQDASNGSASATAVTVTISPTAGNAIVFTTRSSIEQAIAWTYNGATGFTPSLVGAGASGHSGNISSIVCKSYVWENIPISVSSITGTLSSTARFGIIAAEHDNIALTNSIDALAEAIGTSAAPTSASTATTAQANELVVGVLDTSGTIVSGAAGTGYSNYEARPSERVAACSKYVIATGTFQSAFTMSSQAWYSACITVKEIVAGVVLPPFFAGDLSGLGTSGRFFKDRL